MPPSQPFIGILLALGALFSWAFGDYMIQKSSRATGIWPELFFNAVFGIAMILPFAWSDLKGTFAAITLPQLSLLSFISLIVVVVAVIDFRALKEGKLSVVEPILGMELPVTIVLSVMLAHEFLSSWQLMLILAVFLGTILAATKETAHLFAHRRISERGVLFAVIGCVLMGATNFVVGYSSQEISPMVTLLAMDFLLLIVSLFYLLFRGHFGVLYQRVKTNWRLVFAQAFLDNLAWIFFAFSTTFIPIAIATTVSESYIAITVILGLYVNREHLRKHQKLGVALAIFGVIALSLATGGV